MQTLYRKMKPAFLAMAKVQFALEEPFLVAAQVKGIVGISQKMFVYWFAKAIRNVKTDTRDIDKPTWRRFSVLDLFGFGVLRELRRLRVELSVCERVLAWLRANLTENATLLYPLSDGIRVLVVIDGTTIRPLVGSQMPQRSEVASPSESSAIHLSLEPIFRFALKSAPRKDFHVRFPKNTTKVSYCVKGEWIVLKEVLPTDILD
jgi:hypothetical protein